MGKLKRLRMSRKGCDSFVAEEDAGAVENTAEGKEEEEEEEEETLKADCDEYNEDDDGERLEKQDY